MPMTCGGCAFEAEPFVWADAEPASVTAAAHVATARVLIAPIIIVSLTLAVFFRGRRAPRLVVGARAQEDIAQAVVAFVAPAYSNGPWLSGTLVRFMPNVHGRAHVCGSSKWTDHSIVLAPTGLNRSVIVRYWLESRYAVWSVKFVVSTTSVSPSQWPRASPRHASRILGLMCGRLSSAGLIRVSFTISYRMATYPGP